MKLIKVKKVKKIVWHNIADLYDYSTTTKEPHFIVELDEDEYLSLAQKEKEEKDERRQERDSR